MTSPIDVKIEALDIDAIKAAEGRVVVFCDEGGKLDTAARRVNKLTRGAVERLVGSDAFGKLKPGEAAEIGWPSGMAAEAVQVVRLPRRPAADEARRAGATIGKGKNSKDLLVLAGTLKRVDEVVLGLTLRAYAFSDHKSKKPDPEGGVTVMVSQPDAAAEDRKSVV